MSWRVISIVSISSVSCRVRILRVSVSIPWRGHLVNCATSSQAKSLAQFAEEVHTGASQLMLDATEHRNASIRLARNRKHTKVNIELSGASACWYMFEFVLVFRRGQEGFFRKDPGP